MDAIADNDVVVAQAGVTPGSAVHDALVSRADVMAMTQAAYEAALRPEDAGGLSHAERAALAVRVARLNAEEGLAAHYTALLDETAGAAAVRSIADPSFTGEGDARLAALLAYTDLVSVRPRDARAEDIAAMQEAGVSDADIVRLAELVAFLAYQIRVVAGLRLMRGAK